MNYSSFDPSCGINRYNNWVPQGCYPGAAELNRRLSYPTNYSVQSNVGCEPEPCGGGIGILGVFAALAGVAVVAKVLRNRKPSEDITIVKHTEKAVTTTPTEADPAMSDPAKGKKPDLTKPVATAKREDKHTWLTAKNVDHKYGHLNYTAYELASADAVDVTLANGTTKAKLHKDAAAAWEKMKADAKVASINLQLNSAYRDKTQQEAEFKAAGGDANPSDAAKTAAPAGHSEHGTGYAIDIGDTKDAKVLAWLKAHAAEYGFVNSFTEGNAQGVNAEPWHWRFEGSTKCPDTSGGAAKAFQAAHDLEKLK